MIKTYEFVATLHLFSDILPHICRLSLVFQREDVDLALVRPQVNATLALLHIRIIHLSKIWTLLYRYWALLLPPHRRWISRHTQKEYYVNDLEEQLQNWFPNMELLDSFCINPSQLDTNASSQLQILIDYYGQGDTPLVEDALRAVQGSPWKHLQGYVSQKLMAGNATVRVLYPNLSTSYLSAQQTVSNCLPWRGSKLIYGIAWIPCTDYTQIVDDVITHNR